MSQLSKQSIRALCTPPDAGPPLPGVERKARRPMISPFEPAKVRVHGVSKGLSHASYDASIAHDLVLGRHPGYVIQEWLLQAKFEKGGSKWNPIRVINNVSNIVAALWDLQDRLRSEPPCYALAYTVEDFCMPDDVSAAVCDKSTFARVFVSAFNTFFDPGFHGNATLELVNVSDKRVEYKAGQGVCQFVFTRLDEPTESPYDGKYQHQTKAAHGPRFE